MQGEIIPDIIGGRRLIPLEDGYRANYPIDTVGPRGLYPRNMDRGITNK